MSKQDRQGVRTPAHVEQKYNLGDLGKNFSEIMGIAQESRKTAQEALAESQKQLTSEEIFNLLTNNGANQGIFRGEDGEIYINANFIKAWEMVAEIIKASQIIGNDGNDQILIGRSEGEGYGVKYLRDGKVYASLFPYGGYPRMYLHSDDGTKIEIQLQGSNGLIHALHGADGTVKSQLWQYLDELHFFINGVSKFSVSADGVGGNIIGRIQGKYAYWSKNSDGTYTLKADS